MHERIVQLFEETFGARPTAVVDVAADGSQRVYHRLIGEGHETAIGAFGPDRDENRAFLSFSRAFRSIDLPVPEIYASDEDAGIWLMEDLGDTTLFDALTRARAEAGGFPDPIRRSYERVVEILPRFQIEGHRTVDYSLAYPREAFDRQSILWDLNYFKYHFLKLAHVPFHEARLERDFRTLADFLLEADLDSFLYRDFQSGNVMLRDGEPWFIDYQGGRRGALHYDVASLLYDAKAALPGAVREALLARYLDALEERVPVDREAFRELFRGYVIVRIMQAMGAYGYRGFFERKPRFLQSVPPAANNIRRILQEGLPVGLPEIEDAFRRIVDEWACPPEEDEDATCLTVAITSFAYRRGYPEDISGHGGGFVFDCRALENPGRLEAYKSLCGMDPLVEAFIEGRPGAEEFWDSTRRLVEAQVDEYRRRGFTSLAVAYGCTGGQHRSVYFAERLGRRLAERFPDVRVRVHHREAAFWPAAGTRAETPVAEPVGSGSHPGGPTD